MGIPKFFRFISERWPLISQLIDGTQIPQFDNLYLDMNSILHNCTHSNDDVLSSPLTEEQMFIAIFAYIDHLFNTIKPQKTFYMAIDGVAPRAKMNQQRARRFRTAVAAEKNLEKAEKDGMVLEKESQFDSNSITPGTEFMAKLTKNIKFFIHQKISSDSNWQNINVILSGHEVPGEGEHKIMEYITTMKAQPDYNANLRHCVYGLDADLIILGLVTHDPHFALLREEVTFGRQASQKTDDLSQQKFFLLHLSLVREYLELEFKELQSELTFEYDFEKILDDFILITYVIGNDFLPNLPDLHINKGAFPLLLETFKQALRKSDGYLNENGTINLKRLGIWLDLLSKFELENFERVDVDLEWFNKQLENISIEGQRKRDRQGKLLLIKQQKKLVGLIKPWILKVYSTKFSVQDYMEDDSKIPTLELPEELISSSQVNLQFIRQFALDIGIIIIHSKTNDTYTAKLDVDGMDPNETNDEFESRVDELRRIIKRYQAAIIVEDEEVFEEQKDIYNQKFIKWKDEYYKEKLGFSIDDEEEMKKLTENYVEGLQWVLYYYYRGCPSWSWYYKYHYAPRISDVKLGLNVLINFNKGTPFKPFQQLMAVLPARSRTLIPVCYRSLMTDEHSPIIDFYPDDVEIDKNGKTAEWEAVVKLSFVDEKRLIDAMATYDLKLTAEERERNSFGKDLIFQFNPQADNVLHSPAPSLIQDLSHDHCYEEVFTLPSMNGLDFKFGLCEGVLLGKNALAGFPTLQTIPFKSELAAEGIVVFNQPSRSKSMILTLENPYQGLTVEQFARENIGEVVYTRWPYLREAKVVNVCDNLMRYEKLKGNNKSSKSFIATPLEHFERDDFEKTCASIYNAYHKTKGVVITNGDEENSNRNKSRSPIEGLVYVKPVTGLIRNKKGAYVKTFSDQVEIYPVQLVVEDVVNKDIRFKERPPLPINEEFPVDTDVVFLGSFAYGCPAKVIGYSSDSTLSVKASKISKVKEPNFGVEQAKIENETIKYYSSREVCRILKISPLFLSKITSSYMVENLDGRRVNIGLELKFEAKKLKVLGYTKRNERGWEYSALAIGFLQEYMAKFSKLFSSLAGLGSSSSIPNISQLFRSNDPETLREKLKEVTSYLKERKSQLIAVSLESESLSRISIAKIEEKIERYVQSPPDFEAKGIKGIPRTAVLDPSSSFQLLSKQFFKLGDRVVYVQSSGKVPVFSKGTVVGIRSLGTKVSLQVIFDYSVISGNTLEGRLKTHRGMSVDSSVLLNLTNRQLVYHSEASAKRETGKNTGGSTPEAIAKAKEKARLRREKIQAEKQKQEQGKQELLSLIKGDKASSKKKEEKEKELAQEQQQRAREEKAQEASIRHDNKAVNNIYSSIMGGMLGTATAPTHPHNFYVPPVVDGQIQGFPQPPAQAPQAFNPQHVPLQPQPQPQQQQQQYDVNEKASNELKSLLQSGNRSNINRNNNGSGYKKQNSQNNQTNGNTYRDNDHKSSRGSSNSSQRGGHSGHSHGHARGGARGGFRGGKKTNESTRGQHPSSKSTNIKTVPPPAPLSTEKAK